MTIEFHCPHCRKRLKTSDDRVGVEAKCPGCGDILVVPGISEAADEYAAGDEDSDPEAGLVTAPVITRSNDSEATRPCPACGTQISAASVRCLSCGELLIIDTPDLPPPAAQFVTSDILSRAWTIFQQRFGVLFGVSFLLWLAQMLIVVGAYGLFILIAFFGHRGHLDSSNELLVAGAVFVPALSLWSMFTCFFQGGYRRVLLDVAQGKPASLSQLFSGGRFFWRLLGANLLFASLVIVGSLLLVAPGVYAVLALWPFSYVIVDQDCGVVEAFERSWKLTTGNRLAGFVLMLALVGIHFGASFIPCFGVFVPLVSEPFMLLSLAVTYMEMNGRLTAERNPPG